jgi:CRISPR-associated protein Cmr2
MARHLLHISLGPVQEFIAQARRTRDLYQGSELLSKLSRCAAKKLQAEGELLIPAEYEKGSSVTNKLYAVVPEGIEPCEIAKAVKKAVEGHWVGIAAQVKAKDSVVPLLDDGIDEAWNEQVVTLLEFYAAWEPLSDDHFEKARQKVERAVAARKNLRAFRQWEKQRAFKQWEKQRGKKQRVNVPKSSLDGGRETVLKKERKHYSFKKYRINDGEQLDAIGVIKRCLNPPDHYPAIVNVAVGPWIEKVHKGQPDLLKDLRSACKSAKVHTFEKSKACVEHFPYDASVFFESRWEAIEEEQKIELGSVKEIVRKIVRKCGEPHPYVACLVADGDHMGRRINQCSKPDELKGFSKKLSGFAGAVKGIIEDDHQGSLVYAGGDDVLAFVPLATALDCADKLRKIFREKLGEGATLSVGLGIGHEMEAMGELLELGREAEKLAKGAGLDETKSRNALGIILDKRSGGRRSWRKQWTENPKGLIEAAQKVLTEQLGAKKVYEIEDILRRLPEPPEVEDQSAWTTVLQKEVERALGRAGGEAGLDLKTVGLNWKGESDYPKTRELVGDWINRYIIARELDRAKYQDDCEKDGKSNG